VMPLARALSSDDVLWPALADVPVARTARAVRVVRTAPDAGDSAFARAGGVVVRWDSIGARRAAPDALAMGDAVIVASLAREKPAGSGAVLARWSDGSPAAVEQRLGAGCVRDVAIGLPVAGDLPLRPAFQRVVRGLVGPCLDALRAGPAAGDSAIRLALGRATSAANGVALSMDTEAPSPIAAWLIAVALLCALAEPVLRARGAEQPA
jgi:hypothetical protein